MFTGKTRSKTIGSVTVEPGFKWYPEVSRLYQVLRDSESYTMTNQEIYACSAVIYGFKNAGVYGRISTFYPFCGTTAATQKYNLMNAQNTDAAFRLVFNGGWTHSANGILPNGTTGYADTFWVPNTNASNAGCSFGLYNRSQNSTNGQFMGCVSSSNRFLDFYVTGGIFGSRSGINTNNLAFPSLSTIGSFVNRRNSTTDMQVYRNDWSSSISTALATSMPTTQFTLGATRTAAASISLYNNWELACVFMCLGLTNSEALAMKNLQDTFAKIMNRFVPV